MRVNGRTVVTRAFATSPVKLLNPQSAGTSALIYLATYGGGLVGGDTIDVDIELLPSAAAVVATQASTKVYRSDFGASQRLRATAADDSLLAWLPDPVTCFAGARYRQDQRIHLARGANLVFLDWLTAGRVGSGERWRFDEYSSRTTVWRDGLLLWEDGLRLAARDGDLVARSGRFNCIAALVLLGPALRTAALRLRGEIGTAAAPRRSDLLMSAAPLADDGVLVRVAGVSTEQVGVFLRQRLSMLASIVGEAAPHF